MRFSQILFFTKRFNLKKFYQKICKAFSESVRIYNVILLINVLAGLVDAVRRWLSTHRFTYITFWIVLPCLWGYLNQFFFAVFQPAGTKHSIIIELSLLFYFSLIISRPSFIYVWHRPLRPRSLPIWAHLLQFFRWRGLFIIQTHAVLHEVSNKQGKTHFRSSSQPRFEVLNQRAQQNQRKVENFKFHGDLMMTQIFQKIVFDI